jgi:hypothetical protein
MVPLPPPYYDPQAGGGTSENHELIYPPIQEFWDAAMAGTG